MAEVKACYLCVAWQSKPICEEDDDGGGGEKKKESKKNNRCIKFSNEEKRIRFSYTRTQNIVYPAFLSLARARAFVAMKLMLLLR